MTSNITFAKACEPQTC